MYNSYLRHHGIKGMRWGVRRFQKKNGRLTAAGKKRYSDDSDGANDSENRSSGIRLTDKQKKAIKIGAAVAGTALLAYGAYKIGSKHIGRLEKVGEIKVDEMFDSNGLKLQKTRPSSIGEQLKHVNPSKSDTNCRACSIASILRFKGYDVEAIGSVQGGSLSEAINTCFKEPKIKEMYSPNKERVSNFILKKFEEGSSGAMAAEFNMPLGGKKEHAFNWIIKDGKVLFADGQSDLGDASRYLDLLSPDKVAEIVRLDNLEINFDGIKQFVNNR